MHAKLCTPLALVAIIVAVAPGAGNGDWKYDTIQLKVGRTLQGLVVKDAPDEITLQVIRRKTGRPTVTFLTTLPRTDVKQVTKLTGKDRDELVARLNAVNPAGQLEDPNLKQLELQPAFLQVIGFERKKGVSYFSDYFELTSNAPEEIVRRVAVRLEQIFAAYNFLLPPVNRPPKTNTTTTIILFHSVAEYQASLKGRGILNPTCYDPASNEIYCGADLQPLGKKLEELRRQQAGELERIKQQEAALLKLPKGEVQDRARQQIGAARRELIEGAERNEELLRIATRPLLHSLYHEAFHSYLSNYLFSPDKGEVPRWLNEGLAQVFETSLAEGNTLRIGNVDPGRLNLAQTLLARGQLVPLAELLRSGSRQFVVEHGKDRQAADRHYATSWALVHYLLFGRRVLSGPALHEFLTAINSKIDPDTGKRDQPADPAEGLKKLTGVPLPQLEKDFHQYVLKLQADSNR